MAMSSSSRKLWGALVVKPNRLSILRGFCSKPHDVTTKNVEKPLTEGDDTNMRFSTMKHFSALELEEIKKRVRQYEKNAEEIKRIMQYQSAFEKALMNLNITSTKSESYCEETKVEPKEKNSEGMHLLEVELEVTNKKLRESELKVDELRETLIQSEYKVYELSEKLAISEESEEDLTEMLKQSALRVKGLDEELVHSLQNLQTMHRECAQQELEIEGLKKNSSTPKLEEKIMEMEENMIEMEENLQKVTNKSIQYQLEIEDLKTKHSVSMLKEQKLRDKLNWVRNMNAHLQEDEF